MAITLKIDAEKARRVIHGEKMPRRGFQKGSLFKRGARSKVWVARWWEDVVDTGGVGKRIRRSEVLGSVADLPTRREAMQLMATRLGNLNSGTARPQSTRTFSEFVNEDWSPVTLPTLKYATQKHYKYMLDVHLIPAFGNRQLRTLNRQEIQGFLLEKLKAGLAWETVHHFKCGLSKILGEAEEWGFITDNPAGKTKLPRRQRDAERQVLAASQVRDLALLLGEPARSISLMLALTGMRVGELLALRWRNVDTKARVLRVSETVYEGHFDRPKTKRSLRTIPLGVETAEILARLRPSVAAPSALVFGTAEGLPLDRRNLLRKHVKPAAKKLGLGNVTWHLLRHSYATMLDGVGTPVGTMQSLLGHSAPEITREIYLHAIPDEQRRAVESVESLILGPNWTQVLEAARTTTGAAN